MVIGLKAVVGQLFVPFMLSSVHVFIFKRRMTSSEFASESLLFAVLLSVFILAVAKPANSSGVEDMRFNLQTRISGQNLHVDGS